MKKISLRLSLLSILILLSFPIIYAQESEYQVVEADTLAVDSTLATHSPRKAAMYSVVLPGMGQIYNKKYWKLPIVYGGLAGFGYAAIWNNREYRYYFDLYKIMTENGYQEWEGRTFREVEWYKNTHLRYKNLMIILTVGFYALQIVDASVDAHLINFDISEDISLNVDPVLIDPAPANPALTGPAITPPVFRKAGPPGSLPASFGLRCCLSF